jgi:RHS repeat-associated protein
MMDSTRFEELDQSGNVLARYAQTTNVDEPLAALRSGTTSYYDADALGSITALTNSAGSVANTYRYDSFGKLTASTGTLTNPFQYTGREFDPETGAYYYRARYFDQNAGRFISEDPIVCISAHTRRFAGCRVEESNRPLGYEPTGNRNFNNLQDAGWPSKSLVRSVRESLVDSERTASFNAFFARVRMVTVAEND